MGLIIGGSTKTDLLVYQSLSIADELNTRNTCEFMIQDKTSTSSNRPTEGQEVIFTYDSTSRIFGGTIDGIVEEKPIDSYGSTYIVYGIRCVDYNQLCDRHLVADYYSSQSLGSIVTDIVTDFLSTEGVTTTNVQTGPTIERAVFNYQTITNCFNELCDLTGYSWYIDYDKDLHFFSRETNIAPFSIIDSSTNFRNVRITTTREQYRNLQYIRGGQDIGDSRTEDFIGDGTRKTFSLSLAVAEKPSLITVDGVSKDIGIRGVNSTNDWYWSKGEKEITQDDGATALSSTKALAVTFKGLTPLIVSSRSDSEISTRQSVEGGSGIYEAIDDDPNIDTQELALDKSGGLLRRFGRIPRIVEFETDTPGLAAGQLITINLTTHNLNDNFLIDNVSMRDYDGEHLRYQIRCLDGERLGGWVEFFQKLTLSGRKFVIRENEVLVLLRTFSDSATCSDSLTVTSTGPTIAVVGTAIVGYCEVSS